MAKEEPLKFEGEVIESLPNATWRVRLPNNNVILAYLGGKLRKFDINIAVGDRVDLEMSIYDLSKGRIVYRN
jgi:translation initiation factor IF-1